MPPAVVFGIGLLADLLGLSPIGATVLVLLIVHGLAVRWRRYLVRQGFMLVWLVLLGVAAGAALLQWALTCAPDGASVLPGAGPVPMGADGRALPRSVADVHPGSSRPGQSRAGMKKENRTTGVFTRRALLLAGGQVSVIGVLAAKLYQVQVVEGGPLRHPGG